MSPPGGLRHNPSGGAGCLCGVVVLGSSFRAREQELLALDRGMRVCDYIIMYIILGEKGEC